jgi:hypothetical protein
MLFEVILATKNIYISLLAMLVANLSLLPVFSCFEACSIAELAPCQ